MPSEPHKPGLEESDGTFRERNFRSAAFISAPIRIPRNSNTGRVKAGGRAVKGKSGAVRRNRTPEASGTAGICANTENEKATIKAHRTSAFNGYRTGSTSEPPFLSVAQRDRPEGCDRKYDGDIRKGLLKTVLPPGNSRCIR